MPLIDLNRPSDSTEATPPVDFPTPESKSPPDDSRTPESKVPIQIWYADDSQAAGKLLALRRWWDKLWKIGPKYGYFPKPPKTFLIVKPGLIALATQIFEGTGVQIVGGAN